MTSSFPVSVGDGKGMKRALSREPTSAKTGQGFDFVQARLWGTRRCPDTRPRGLKPVSVYVDRVRGMNPAPTWVGALAFAEEDHGDADDYEDEADPARWADALVEEHDAAEGGCDVVERGDRDHEADTVGG